VQVRLRGNELSPILVFAPVVAMVLLVIMSYQVHLDVPDGSWSVTWPNLAAIWITLTIFIVAAWVMARGALPPISEKSLFGIAILAWALTTWATALFSLILAVRTTGFPSEWHHVLEWFSLTSGLAMLSFVGIVGQGMKESLWGKAAYGFAIVLGAIMVLIAMGLSVLMMMTGSIAT